MKPEGPYREMNYIDTNDQIAAIKKMEKEVSVEGKVSIRLPENMEINDPAPLFAEAIEFGTDPKDIVFYSLATGILKFRDQGKGPSKKTFYNYNNPDNKDIGLTVLQD